MTGQTDAIGSVLGEIVEPLVRADGGRLYVVEVTPTAISLHLAGRFSGCPGNTLAIRGVIEPVLRKVAPDAALTVTAGVLVPAGASLVRR